MQRSELRLRFGAIVLVGALWLGGCNLINSAPDDNAIVSEIQGKLFEDPVLKTRDIHVNSQKGVVVLTGSVGTDLEKGATERLANEAKGVKQVIDQLAISATTAQVAAPATPAESAPQESAAVPKPHHRARRAPRPEAPSDAAPVPAPAAPQSAVAQPAPVVEAAPERPPAPLQATIPAGSVITVRMIDSVDSSRNHAGDEFDATVNSPVVAGDRVAIPQGSNARVRLVEAKTAGHMTGRSELQLELVSLTVNATTYNVESGNYQLQGASRGKRTAETVGGGAGLGALIGAIAGRGKGAAIGAGIGAAAGAGAQAITKGQQVKIPSETKIDFTLKAPLAVTLTQ